MYNTSGRILILVLELIRLILALILVKARVNYINSRTFIIKLVY